MWEMKTTVSKELYAKGYRLDGKENRVDIIGPDGKKCFEIFFFGRKDIRVRKGKECWKINEILKIFIGKSGKPEIEASFLII